MSSRGKVAPDLEDSSGSFQRASSSRKKGKKKSCVRVIVGGCISAIANIGCNIWTAPIKKIGERFGASVRGYMMFVRSLFWLNFFCAAAWLGALQIPQIAEWAPGVGASEAGGIFRSMFTGTEGLERSFFYYSGYGVWSMPKNLTVDFNVSNSTFYVKGSPTPVYEPIAVKSAALGVFPLNVGVLPNIDVWYLGLIFICYMYALLFILSNIFKFYGPSYDPPVGSNNYDAGRAVFDAWDFSVNHKSTSDDLIAKICGTMIVLRDGINRAEKKAAQGCVGCIIAYTKKLIGILLTVALLIIFAGVIGAMINPTFSQYLIKQAGIPNYAAGFVFPLALAAMNGSLPAIMKLIVKIEDWSMETQVQQLILRVYIIKLFNLFITIYTPFQDAQKENIQALYRDGVYDINGERTAESAYQAFLDLCIEDTLGMILWKLCITDMFVQAVTNSFVLKILFKMKRSGNMKPKKLRKYREDIKVEALAVEVNRLLQDTIDSQAKMGITNTGLEDKMLNYSKKKKDVTKAVLAFVQDPKNAIETEAVENPKANTDKDPMEWVVGDAAAKYFAHLGGAAGNETVRGTASGSGNGAGAACGSLSGSGLGKGGMPGASDGSEESDEPEGEDGDGDDRPGTAGSRPSTALDGPAKANYVQMAKDRAMADAKKEYDVPTNIINLMYQQCLIFIGMPFAPMLFVLGLLGYLVTFWVQYDVLISRSKAPESANVGSAYYRFLGATWVYSTVIVSGIWLTRQGNQFCGPFSASTGAEVPLTDVNPAIYRTFHFYILNRHEWLVENYTRVVSICFSAIIMCFCCGCCFVTCMFYERGSKQKSRVGRKANATILKLETERRSTMQTLSDWSKATKNSIPGLADESVPFLQDTEVFAAAEAKADAQSSLLDNERLKFIADSMNVPPRVRSDEFSDPEQYKAVGHFPRPEYDEPEADVKHAGIPVDCVSDFMMWRTGRARLDDPNDKNSGLTFQFPYNTVANTSNLDNDSDNDL